MESTKNNHEYMDDNFGITYLQPKSSESLNQCDLIIAKTFFIILENKIEN